MAAISQSEELSLRQLAKRWPDNTVAVQDLTLEVARQETIALIGPTGSGKTTTLRLIAGLETPSSGHIYRQGREVTHLPAHQRNLSFQFQRPALYPHLTVQENLLFADRLKNSRASMPERILEIVNILSLENLLKKKPFELSGGQQQRVALGRALARNVSLCLLDEPLTHLDSRLHQEIRQGLLLFRKRFPTTIIIVTHHPWDALALGDRIAVLQAGRLHQLATPDVIRDQPASLTVAQLIHGQELTVITNAQECLKPGCSLRGTLALPRGAVNLWQSNSEGVWIEGKLIDVEPVQPRLCLLRIQCEDRHLLLMVEQRPASTIGTIIRFSLDLSQAFWFDGNTGFASGVHPGL